MPVITRRPSWVTALMHETERLLHRDEVATPHEHRTAFRLDVWQVRELRREARDFRTRFQARLRGAFDVP